MSVKEYSNGILYHYTSENGILGIFKKDQLVFHITKANSLNDKSEGKDLFEILDIVCNKLKQNGDIDDDFYFKILSIFQGDINSAAQKGNYCKSTLSKIRSKIEDSNMETFIMSFSSAENCLPMWNYYTNAGLQGYSISINKAMLNSVIKSFSYEWEISFPNVIYHTIEKKRIVSEAIYDGIKCKSIQPIIDMINIYQYIFKHEAFEYENEVRMIVKVPKKTIKESEYLKFKSRNGIIIPYLELPITINPSNLIFGVTVGPLSYETIAEENLIMYLKMMGFEFAAKKVSTTDIPIRF